jgi:hypothetical protein
LLRRSDARLTLHLNGLPMNPSLASRDSHRLEVSWIFIRA